MSPNVHEQKHRSEVGPPPPPPQHPQSVVVATPPPPPPPNQFDGSPQTPGGYQSSRYRDPRSDRTDPRSDARSGGNGKNAYGQAQEITHGTGSLDNGNWDGIRRGETKTPETQLPELSDLTSYAQFCCRKAYEDVAGWMGSIFERQVILDFNSANSRLLLLTPSYPEMYFCIRSSTKDSLLSLKRLQPISSTALLFIQLERSMILVSVMDGFIIYRI